MTAIEDTVFVVGEQAHDVRILLDGYGIPTEVDIGWLHPGDTRLDKPWLGVIGVGVDSDTGLRIRNAGHLGFSLLHLDDAATMKGRPPSQVLLPYEYGDPSINVFGIWSTGLPDIRPTSDARSYLRYNLDKIRYNRSPRVPLGIIEACVHAFVVETLGGWLD